MRNWKIWLLSLVGILSGWLCHHDSAINVFAVNLPPTSAISVKYENSVIEPKTNSLEGNYRWNGEWIGRLILPSRQEIKLATDSDWVWVEIKRAPAIYQQLIGKTIRLTWQPKSTIQVDAAQVTTDIQFTPETIASQRQGNIHPQRLNGRSRVGPIQSLAGARSGDDLLVRLNGVGMVRAIQSELPTITIDREPIQITGTLKGLVKILGTDPRSLEPLPIACPGTQPCPSEYVRVQHYNLASQQFDGQIETVRLPQMPAKKSGLFPNSIRDLDRSPAGSAGWYIYGDRDVQGLFTVAAIQPRSLFRLAPDLEIGKSDAKLDYLDRLHWQNTPQQQGKLAQVVFDRRPEQSGTKALVIHSFGGIGGKTGDPEHIWQTITGHFAYGIATIQPDEFTHELQWSIDYNQVYAHNPDGIVAGKQDWATYLGHLQRGWLATRPVSDLLISYPPVTEDYNFGGVVFSPLTELQRQLHIFAARYRTGDGTGSASVTPATSCVQDANQALYITIQKLKQQLNSQPQIQAWLTDHPTDLQTLRFRALQALGTELETTLTPLGIVRQDWQQNAAKLVGTGVEKGFTSSSNPFSGLTSWRTMLPRGAQDGMAKIFSQHRTTIWFLNTYQVGGLHPEIWPIAPTIILGQMPLLSTIIMRLWAGVMALPSLTGWLSILAWLIGYILLALAIGWRSGFLTVDRREPIWDRSIGYLFLMPALVEEIVFRLLLIPHPIELTGSKNIYLWMIISLALFIIYHPLNALTLHKPGNPTFMDWRFLCLTGLLGIVCTIVYLTTGSIWGAVVIHWLVVVGWLKLFGGERRLGGDGFC